MPVRFGLGIRILVLIAKILVTARILIRIAIRETHFLLRELPPRFELELPIWLPLLGLFQFWFELELALKLPLFWPEFELELPELFQP